MKLPAAKRSLKISRLWLGCNERQIPEIVTLSQLFQSIYVIVYLGEHLYCNHFKTKVILVNSIYL